MPYTVFALKWRPQNFDQILGQDHIVTILKSALEKNRLAHAYLFAGPRGVGKTSTARILAKSLNCKEGPTVKPCQKCPACLEISQGRSLDVIEIDGASNRGIDEIRTLRENVKFSPVQGKFKIYIIDEVHMLTTEAFNALLKTLEEPPEFVKFIFATTQANKVIPTILSRCQRFDFRRIPVIEIIAQLELIIKQEKIAVDKEVLFAIARASDGSLRDAESILDQLVSFSQNKISLKDVISVLGVVEQEALFEIAEKIIHKDARGALSLFNSLVENGKDAGTFLNNLIEHFRNLMIARVAGADMKLLDLPEDICEKLRKQSGEFTLEEVFSAFNILIGAQEMSRRLDSLRIPIEISLVRLAHAKKGPGPFLEKEPGPFSKQEKEPSGKDKNPPPEVPKANKPAVEAKERPTSNPGISLDKIKENWQAIINSIEKIKISVASYLGSGEPTKIEGSILSVSFPLNHSLHKESLERKDNREIVEKCISDLLHTDLRLNFTLSQDLRHKTEAEGAPFLRSALDIFKGRVIREG